LGGALALFLFVSADKYKEQRAGRISPGKKH